MSQQTQDPTRSAAHSFMKEVWAERGAAVEETHSVTGSVKVHIEDGLFNPNASMFLYVREKPWHRFAAECAAAGHTIPEIASACGKTVSAVRRALAQPFAQERIVKQAAKNASEEIREILEQAAPESLRRVIKLAEAGAASDDIELKKLAAAQDREILDRFLGKSAQPITHAQGVDVKKLTEAELDNIIATATERPSPSVNGEETASEYS